MYYWLVSRMEPDKRRDLDRLLESGSRRDERGRAVPTWWKGEEDASRSALATAQAMGFNVAQMTAAAAAG